MTSQQERGKKGLIKANQHPLGFAQTTRRYNIGLFDTRAQPHCLYPYLYSGRGFCFFLFDININISAVIFMPMVFMAPRLPFYTEINY